MYTEKVVQIIEALAGEPFSEWNPIDGAIIRFSIVNRPHLIERRKLYSPV